MMPLPVRQASAAGTVARTAADGRVEPSGNSNRPHYLGIQGVGIDR